MRKRIGLGFLLAITAVSARAEDKPVKVELPIPSNALAAVQLKGVASVRERLEKFLAAAAPEQSKIALESLVSFLDEGLAGRDAKLLPRDARTYLIVHDVDWAAKTGTWSLALPMADYKLFRTKFLTADERKSIHSLGDNIDEIEFRGQPTYLIDLTKRGYVAVTFDKPTAEALAEKPKLLTTADVGPQGTDVFLESDLGAFVNLREVNERYGKSLASFRSLAIGLLQQGGFGFLPKLDRRQLAVARLVVDGLFQTGQDGHGFALGISFAESGLILRTDLRFKTESESASVLAKEKPSKLASMEELNSGQIVYKVGSWSPPVAAIVQGLAPDYAAAADDDRTADAVKKFANLSAKATWSSASSGVGSGILVATIEDPAALAAAHVKVLKNPSAGGAYRNVPLKEAPTIKVDEQMYGGFTLSRALLNVDFKVATATIADETLREATIESMKRFVQEKTAIWFGHDGERYVEITSANWDDARGFLDTYRSKLIPLSADVRFQELRKLLPAEASQLVVVDLRKGLVGFAAYAQAVLGALPAFPGVEIPEFKPAPAGPPEYAGAALVLRPAGIGAVVVVPIDSAKLIAGVLAPPVVKAP